MFGVFGEVCKRDLLPLTYYFVRTSDREILGGGGGDNTGHPPT